MQQTATTMQLTISQLAFLSRLTEYLPCWISRCYALSTATTTGQGHNRAWPSSYGRDSFEWFENYDYRPTRTRQKAGPVATL